MTKCQSAVVTSKVIVIVIVIARTTRYVNMSLSLCHDQTHERGRSFIHVTAKAAKVWADQVLRCKPIHYNAIQITTLH